MYAILFYILFILTFLSETVVKTLVDTFGLQPITAPEQDMDTILSRV